MNKTIYSRTIRGTKENWNRPVVFERIGKLLAVTQYGACGTRVRGRVLLTLQQFRELLRFAEKE